MAATPAATLAPLDRHDAACRALAQALSEVRSVSDAKILHDRAALLRAVALKTKDFTLLTSALEYRYRALRELGRLMDQQRRAGRLARGGRPYQATGLTIDPVNRLPTLEELGIGKYLADQARKAFRLPEEVFEGRIAKLREMAATGLLRRLHLSPLRVAQEDRKLFSPPDLVEAARGVMGTIDFDPCSCQLANRVVGAHHYLSLESGGDGLAAVWHGHVWMNPPYLPGAVLFAFTTKLAQEFKAGRVTEACTLQPNIFMGEPCYQELTLTASALCFPAGRVVFYDQKGGNSRAPRGSVVFYLGPRPRRFAAVFGRFGTVVFPSSI